MNEADKNQAEEVRLLQQQVATAKKQIDEAKARGQDTADMEAQHKQLQQQLQQAQGQDQPQGGRQQQSQSGSGSGRSRQSQDDGE